MQKNKGKKIIVVTDTWEKHDGVVTTIVQSKKCMERDGMEVTVIHPKLFKNFPLPTYPELKIAIFAGNKLKKIFETTKPDFIHITTEGPLGLAARIFCVENGLKFTTSYHTQLPEYIRIRLKLKIVEKLIWKYLTWFHSKSEMVMVSTNSLKEELEKHEIKKIKIVPLGTNLDLFKKNPNAQIPENFKKPIFTFLGRLAPEKNIEAFLKLDLPGTKLVIGDGPHGEKIRNKFNGKAVFVGYKKGQDLVDLLSISDVFVFPSKTDTFGLVILEALACGLPIAAYNVQGPKDVIENGKTGYLGDNLRENALKCLKIDKKNCREEAEKYSWDAFTEKFLENLVPAQPSHPASPSQSSSKKTS